MSTQLQVGQISIAKIVAHPSNIGRDLGDLREMVASVRAKGVLVPVVVERQGAGYRLRDGHRRVAAARLANVGMVTALIHTVQLDEADWLMESLDYNERRKGYTDDDKRWIADRLVELGVEKGAIAEAFGCTWSKITQLITAVPGPRSDTAAAPAGQARSRAVRRLTEAHAEEFAQILLEEGYPRSVLVENVADLLAVNETPAAIAARLGKTLGMIEKSLIRAGRSDLARPFSAAVQRERDAA